MPNWCSNILELKGSPDELDKFEQAHTKDPNTDEKVYLTFKADVPYPADITENGKYDDWRTGFWGCKWDAQNVEPVRNNSDLQYTFLTPWSPPLQWLIEASKNYPEIKFYLGYSEEGVGFQGSAVAKAGKVRCREIENYELNGRAVVTEEDENDLIAEGQLFLRLAKKADQRFTNAENVRENET